MKKQKLILIAIIVLAFVLRFVKLGEFPALNADEASIGYNAYSLIKTGLDEHGNPWPIHFQSFNDYKPGLFFYIVLPFVKLFDLNVWSVRIPGASLGVLTVLSVYFLVKEMFPKKKWFAEISAFLLSISPWHIHFSRGGWEVNAATFFITTGVLFFVKATKKPKYYFLSFLMFLFSLYTYHSARIIIPLLGLGFLIYYWKSIKTNIKTFIFAILFAGVLLIPLAKDILGPAGMSRAAGVGLFADVGPINRINEQRGSYQNISSLPAVILHNKVVNYGLEFVKNWVEHFDGEFLFLSGDEIQRNKVPETGQMYMFEVLTILIGLVMIVRNAKGWAPILIWLFVGPMAAALTFQSPHALRAHNMVVPLTIISAFGLTSIFEFLKTNKRFLKIGTGLIVFVILWSFLRYEQMYWKHMAKEYPFSSQYGLKELAEFVKENGDKYEKIIITDRYDQPYILMLFYLKYPPQEFQKEHDLTARDSFGFSTVNSFNKFVFSSIGNWSDIRSNNKNSLIVGTDEEIPDEANIIKEIYGDNGYKYFQIVAN